MTAQKHPRIIRSGPLDEIWDESGTVAAEKVRQLGEEDIREMLRAGCVAAFIVANLGDPLHWIRGTERYDLWKNEVQPHLWKGEKPRLEDYANEYFYMATEWQLVGGAAVVLFEKHH